MSTRRDIAWTTDGDVKCGRYTWVNPGEGSGTRKASGEDGTRGAKPDEAERGGRRRGGGAAERVREIDRAERASQGLAERDEHDEGEDGKERVDVDRDG